GQRAPQAFKVVVRGKDRNGNPFAQTSNTVDISEDGARLEGVAYLTAPGDIIEVKRRWHGKARFRVAWIGQIGTFESNQVGVCTGHPGPRPCREKQDHTTNPKPLKQPQPTSKMRSGGSELQRSLKSLFFSARLDPAFPPPAAPRSLV